jgi:hypothetical protein
MTGLIQLIIATTLFFVLLFGIGFILNMLLKTTWLTVYLYFIVVIPLVIYSQWEAGETLWANITGYTIVDYVTALGGLGGAILSGWAIKTLRVKGYQMF